MKFSKEIKFGVYAIIAVVAFIVGIRTMQGKRLIGNSMIIYAKYPDAKGVIRGNPIRINGLDVGQVMDLQLQGDSVLIEMELHNERPIPVDSRAVIFTKDLLGAMAIRLDRGKSSELIQDEGFVMGGTDAGAMGKATELLESEGKTLLADVSKMIANLASITAKLDTSFSDLQERDELESILKNMDRSMASFATISHDLEKTMPNLQTFSEGLAENKDKLSAIVTNFKTTSDSLALATGELTASANSAMKGMDEVVRKINDQEGSLGKLIGDKGLYDELNGTVQSVKSLIGEVQKNPKKYLDVDVYLFERKKKAPRELEALKQEVDSIKKQLDPNKP